MMEMRTNIVAITTNRHLVNHATQMGRGIRRVSSGFRINSAADDASGAAIANMMRSQLRGINQAIRNTQDATSMIQTADAGLHQINDMVQRIRELVVTAANDSTTIEQREMLQIEINQLTDEINAISDRTQYNSTGLLSGNTGRLSNNLRMGDNFTPFTRSLPSFYNTASLHIFQSQQAPPLPNAIVISQLDLVDGASGTGWNFTDGVLNITGIGLPDQINFQIRGTGTETDNRIVVNEGVTAGIILENVNLVSSQGPALDVRNSTVDLRLVGRSVMISNASGAAGVQTTGGDLTIHGPGSLEARGGYEEGSPLGGGAGIGGAAGFAGGTVDIRSGTITATGAGGGAGIGGGANGAGTVENGSIIIRDGNVTASGGTGLGAGIGGGVNGAGTGLNGIIDIRGGIIEARGGTIVGVGGGAGIGGGFMGDGGNILTTAGRIDAFGGQGGAGIGGGFMGDGGNVTVDGGIVRAQGGILRFAGTTTVVGAAAVGGGVAGGGANLTVIRGLLEIMSGQWIGGGQNMLAQPPTLSGTTTVQGGNLSINPDDIFTNIYHRMDLTIAPHAAHRVEIIIQDIDRNRLNLTPETSLAYTMDGRVINATVDSRGRLFMYLPIGFTGEVIFRFDDEAFVGSLNVETGHRNRLFLRPMEPDYVPAPEMPGFIVHFQVGPNTGNSMFMYMPVVNAQTLGLVDGANNPLINVVRQSGEAIAWNLSLIVDRALERTAGEMGRMAGAQSRLESVIQTLTVSEENLAETESRIRDADIAAEMLRTAHAQAMQQAAMHVLAQANRLPEVALRLISFDNAPE